MLKDKYICIAYIFLWGFYNTQGLFGLTGSTLTQLLILFLTAVSLFYTFAAHLQGKVPVYLWTLDGFLLLSTGYGVAYMFSDGVALYVDEKTNTFNYIKTIYNSLLPIYFFYYYSRKGVLTETFMKKLTVWFLLLVYLEYWTNEIQIRREMAMKDLEEYDELVNNMGYAFLSLIPAIAFWEKRVAVQYAMLLYIVVFVFLGMKRGAILICLVCVALFLWKSVKNASRQQKGVMLLMTVLVMVVTAIWVKYLMETSLSFNKRLVDTMQGYTSGRDYLYASCVDYVLHRTTDVQFLFGSGAMATLEVTRSNVAHNDWLELAVNQGMLGVLFYIVYWLGFFYQWRSVRNDPKLYFIVGILLFIYLAKTLFSMSYGGMNIYSTSVLGYCVGTACENHEKENHMLD